MDPATAPKGKLFAVGDVHGCADKLSSLLEKLPLNRAEDRIVFMGDYIDRGPQSRECLDMLLDFERDCRGAVFLEGNHEQALLEYNRTGDLALLQTLRSMGVEATLKSYGNSPPGSLRSLSFLPDAHLDFLRRLKLLHRESGYLFVHAGVLPGETPEESNPDILLNVRKLFLSQPTGQEEIVVFGHTVFETPLVLPGKIGIDTGAAYGNLLTAVELPREGPHQGGLRFYHA